MKFILATVTTGDTDFHVSLQLRCLAPTNLPKAVLFLLSSFFPLLRVRCSAHADYQRAAREVDDDYGSSTCNPKLHRTFVDYFLGLWLLSHGSHRLGLVLSRRRQFLPQFGGFLCRAWEVLNGMRMR
jgi:hypothetical protein